MRSTVGMDKRHTKRVDMRFPKRFGDRGQMAVCGVEDRRVQDASTSIGPKVEHSIGQIREGWI